MHKMKIFNDPVYGFVSVPYGVLFDIIEHPYFQRLRRIKQVSLTHYVYPGALHTRFSHALGAMHLMTEAISVLRSKGVVITDEECQAAQAAILLHDIGHGPFSHTLENTLIDVSHEVISMRFMEELNEQFGGKLDLTIQIFKNEYHKPFLFQLISGQLDMDRMDYLNRDSFFTGVYEGVVGYDRIIKMLDVRTGELVVEEKGIYSIEKFLMARRLMYWQVYLHKTVLSVEEMMLRALRRAKHLAQKGTQFAVPASLAFFLYGNFKPEDFLNGRKKMLEHFAKLDDNDIVSALKVFRECSDKLLVFLASSILDRKLFRLRFQNTPIEPRREARVIDGIMQEFGLSQEEAQWLLITGSETNSTYNTSKEEIKIVYKDGRISPMSEISDFGLTSGLIKKYYLAYPKVLGHI
ncbi:MAG: HD domain-containing protein [Saprospiraceae bacterium]|nr:HD domain-containing protein [Saprospiraceae bacterium]